MLLHKIIESNDIPGTSILIENMIPYKKSLYTYYKNLFCRCEPLLMVVSISNAVQYGIIVSEDCFMDALIDWIGDPDCMNENNENFSEYETICFNSIPLAKL